MAKIGINIKEGSIKNPETVVGIDLGTTNSLIALVDRDSGVPITIGLNGNVIVPSVVYIGAEGIPVVGENAKRALVSRPESTIFSVKRLLGRSYKDIEKHSDFFTYRIIDDNNDQLVRVEVNGKYYSPIELSSFILAELKNRAEQVLGKSISKAVITVPAYFNDSQRQATRDAGKLAGLEILRIVNEPTAASLAYGMGLDNSAAKTIAVYDLGGGTFDISILRIENGVFEVLSTNGDTYLGGDDFDRAIMQHWLQEAKLNISDLTTSDMQELRLLAELAKKEVSNTDKRFVSNFRHQNIDFDCQLTKMQLEELIQPIVDKTLVCTKLCLKDAKLQTADIEEIVMVGGSTRIPLIKKSLESLFPKVKFDGSINPDEVVALGAAVEADILAGNRRDLLLMDVTPLSLGIETVGGLMDVIIPRNSRIPGGAGREYTTSKDGQSSIKITVYQGDRELVSKNRKLAEFVLSGIPSMPAGMPKVEIKFLLDADGIMKVSAQELRSGVKQEISVKPQYGLDDATVEQMLRDSLTNAKDDVNIRMLLEAKTEAEQIIYATKRFIIKNADLINTEEKENTLMLCNELELALGANNRDIMLEGIDKLNEYTKPFATRAMDKVVSASLKGKQIV